MRYFLVVIAFALMLTQSALPAPEKEIIRASRDPLLLSYENALAMGYLYPPMFFNVGQTLSGNPVLVYYGELDLGAGGTVGKLDLWDGSGNYARHTTPSLGSNITYTWLPSLPGSTQTLTISNTGQIGTSAAGTGDVTAAANITDHALVRGDGGAKGIQDADQWIIGDNGDMVGTLANATDHAMSAKVTADAAERWVVRADGAQLFSDGTGAPDTAFQRSQANTLALGTGDALRLVGSAGDHAGPLDGMMHYNSSTNKFRFRENGAWVSLGTVSGTGTDNHVPRFDGTGNIQDSGWVIDDTTNLLSYDDTSAAIRMRAQTGVLQLDGPFAGPGLVLEGYVYGDSEPKVRLGHGVLEFGPGGSSSTDNEFSRISTTQMALSKGLVINENSADADTRVESNGDVNMLYVDAGNDRIGIRTSTPTRVFHVVSTDSGSIPVPLLTTAQEAFLTGSQEGEQFYNSDREVYKSYDGQRYRNTSETGWLPYAYPLHFDPGAAFTTALSLPANGGSIAIPVYLPSHMLLQSVTIRNTDTATARTVNFALYEQRLNNGNGSENTLDRVAVGNALSYTPGAASTRTITCSTAPQYLGPGAYWLVIQNQHATSTFGLGSTASSAAFAPNTAQTKTTTNPNGTTLDFVAATWTKTTAIYAVRLDGRVFGQTTAF